MCGWLQDMKRRGGRQGHQAEPAGLGCICQSHTGAVRIMAVIYWEKEVTRLENMDLSAGRGVFDAVRRTPCGPSMYAAPRE